MTYYFYDGVFQDYLPPPSVDVHEVPVEFDGYEIPGLTARIGAYQAGGPYSLNLPWGFNLGESATQILQEKDRLSPFEWVGGVRCSHDRCVLTTRYSEDTAWRRTLLLIPAAAEAFHAKKNLPVQIPLSI